MSGAFWGRLTAAFVAFMALVSAAHASLYHPDLTAGLVRIGGHEVWTREADKRLPQASLTKLMTALLILEKYRPDAVVTVSAEAARAPKSKIYLHAGDRLRVKDLLAAMLIHSANDACRALAIWQAGSEKAFVRRMNLRAQQLGLHDTHYENACGFDARDHYSSARDIARLALYDRLNPTFRHFTDTREMTIYTVNHRRKFTFRNTNALLGHYPGAEGIKTGFTFAAGPCLVAMSRRQHTTVVIVMLNARRRWQDAREMFNAAFREAADRRHGEVATR